ncbi:MAG: type 4a pilus biogenesis protein PilO [Candidatus Kaiserbacteria bacterium]|nr:type 4a pilus biogenesis protein PilO [Candidatus Kaiserbacteria bacterium]
MFKTIISLIGLVAAVGIFFGYTQPTYDKSGDAKAQIAQYDAALTKATELQQLKQTLLARYNTFDPNALDRLQKLLPDHVDNVRLILDLDNLAGRHGMALQNVVISAPQTDDASQTAVGNISSAKQKYDSLTLKFTTAGSYDTFISFMTDLEQSLRVVDLVSLKLAAADGDSKNPSAAPNYTYDLTIRTYWLK